MNYVTNPHLARCRRGFSSVPEPADNAKRIPPRGPHEAALAPVLRSRGGDAVRRTRLRAELSRKARAAGRPVRRGRRRGSRRAGAGGNIAADHVAKAPADGYTLLITTQGFAISPGLYKKLPFDAVRDFAPVTQLTSSFVVLVANPQLPAASGKELIALAKSRPGAINYGSTGIGAPPHLLGELLKSMTGTDMLHVPYKGDAPLNQALLAGEVQLAFMPLAGVLSHIRSGRLRALGVSGTARSATLPEVPTLTEAGVPFEFTGWLGVFAPEIGRAHV